MIFRAKHFQSELMIDVACEGGRIVSVQQAGDFVPDRQAGYIAPAFFDLQINGALGVAFSDINLDESGIRKVLSVCMSHGISGICPTIITNAHAVLLHGFNTLREACERDSWIDHAMPCFHLEGPYISPEDGPRGAHLKQHVRNPSFNEFKEYQEASGNRIKLLTLAPELPGAIDFIRKICLEGVVVAIGHTAASPDIIREAIAAGASLSTHLGNGSHAMWPRHENYFWEQLGCDSLSASIITDGHHLPEALIKTIVRVKPFDKQIITCDASGLAGLPPGKYSMWNQDIEILSNGKVVVPGTPFLAGSGSFTDDCVAHLISLGLVSRSQAIEMAANAPRRLLQLPEIKIEAGGIANLILFDSNKDVSFQINQVIIDGVPLK
ncbi:MAG: N-acetylglucosamine-6-phosphate deacetylase [Planctomycetes bacterium]|nr:N-acetylglucosamine-6-phosphate deacetylase [Planctomycetota bacterium]NBY01403.1 N-acetylglucosamine-6-phosphate deacetylase [Planctomycetota bacterium]